MKARIVLRLALLLVLSMCTDLIAIGTLAPMIVIGGPSIGDTIFSTITALAVIACAPFVAVLPPTKWAGNVASASLALRIGLCVATACSLAQPDFSANEVLLAISAFWGARVIANDSILRVTSSLCDSDERQNLSIVHAVAPAIAAGAWLVWLHLPLNVLPPASILTACACSYSAVAIASFFWKELWTRSFSAESAIVSHSVRLASEDSPDSSSWNIPLALLQTAATLVSGTQFSLAISENYFPPPHPALHRDLLIFSLAWISAGVVLHLCDSRRLKGAHLLARAAENRFLLLLATIALAPLVVFPGRSVNLFFIALSAAIACLISIACQRIRMSANNGWLNASIASFTIVATYSVAVFMLFQQAITPTYNQWRTLAVICEGILLVGFLIWPATRGALVASVSYMVQKPINDSRASSTAVYLTDSMSLARAALAAAQLRANLLIVTNYGLVNWKPISIVLRYFGVRIANPDRPEFPFYVRDQLGTVVVFWLSTTGGFFEQNSKLIEICFPTVALSRLTITKATHFPQSWRKTLTVSKIVPVTKPVSGRR